MWEIEIGNRIAVEEYTSGRIFLPPSTIDILPVHRTQVPLPIQKKVPILGSTAANKRFTLHNSAGESTATRPKVFVRVYVVS